MPAPSMTTCARRRFREADRRRFGEDGGGEAEPLHRQKSRADSTYRGDPGEELATAEDRAHRAPRHHLHFLDHCKSRRLIVVRMIM